MAGIPKAPILTSSEPAVVGVPGPGGVLTTAVKPSQPAAPVPFSGAVGTPTQDFENIFEQAAQVQGEPLPDPRADAQNLFESRLGPTTTGFFAPSDVSELQSAQGSFGTAFQSGFSEGLLGWMFSSQPDTFRERDKFNAEITNYAASNPWKSFLGQMAGGFLSDSPIELGLAFGTLGVGNALVKGAQFSGRGAKAFQAIASGVNKLRDAYRISGSPGRFRRLISRGLYETGLGAVSGAISETLQQELGKKGNLSDVIERAAFDAAASGIFAEALRFGAKGLRLVRGTSRSAQIADDIARAVSEETGIPVKDLKRPIKESLDDVDLQAKQRNAAEAEGVRIDEAAAARAADDAAAGRSTEAPREADVPFASRPTDTPAARSARKAFNNTPNEGNLRRVLRELLSPEQKGRVGEIVESLARRARGAGKTLDQYLKSKNFEFSLRDKASQIANDTNDIITAPANSTDIGDLLHEIGHLIFSDLDPVHKAAAERIIGSKIGADPLPKEVYEAFADGFRDFILTGEAPSRGVRRMYERVKQWFASVYRKLAGREQLEELDDIFRQIMDETSEPSAKPSEGKRRAEFERRNKAGLKQLFAEGGDRGKKPSDLEAPETPVQESQRIVRERAEATIAPETGVDTVAPRTPIAIGYNKLKEAAGRFLGSDNHSLYGYLKRLGKGWQEIHSLISPSVTNAARMFMKMQTPMRRAFDDISLDRMIELDEVTSVKLETVDGTVDIEMSGTERLKLDMQSVDGFNKARTKVAENSAQESLQTKGFVDSKGNVHKLTDQQLADIQNGSLLSEGEREMRDGLFAAYRAIVKDANEISQKLAGRDIFDAENFFYNPKRSEAEGDVDVLFSVLLGNQKKQVDGTPSPLKNRVGEAELELTNPFQELSGYVDTVSRSLAMAEFNKTAKEALKKSGRRIKALFGKNILATLNDLVDINSGDFSSLGKFTEQGIISRLFTLRQLGLMGASPSVIAKQLGSGWLASASGRVSSSGGEMGLQAGAFIKNRLAGGKDLTDMLDEMAKHNPVMARRLAEHIQIIEFEQTGAGIRSIQFAKGRLTVAELMALNKKKGVKTTDVAAELIQKTTDGIRLADESMLASIWIAVKKDLVKEGQLKEGGEGFFTAATERFNDILLETQPTLDPTSRSFNQMRPGIGARVFTQFTTQTRKIAEFAEGTVYDYINLPKEVRTKEDTAKFMKTMMPLVAQTAYISAVGLTSTTVIGGLVGFTMSEKRRKRVEAQQRGLATKIFQQIMGNTLGTAPIGGRVAADTINAMFGIEPFSTEIPVFGEFNQTLKGVANLDARRIIKGLSKISGVPALINKPVSEAAGRLQEK